MLAPRSDPRSSSSITISNHSTSLAKYRIWSRQLTDTQLTCRVTWYRTVIFIQRTLIVPWRFMVFIARSPVNIWRLCYRVLFYINRRFPARTMNPENEERFEGEDKCTQNGTGNLRISWATVTAENFANVTRFLEAIVVICCQKKERKENKRKRERERLHSDRG